MKEHLRRFAEAFGVRGMTFPDRMPNTRRALAASEWARDRGRLDAFRDAVMRAHWEQGKDIEDGEVLAACAARAGLDPDGARAAAGDPRFQERVAAMGAEAGRAGVSGIPTFVAGAHRVVGCQPYEEIAAAVAAAGARRRPATAAERPG
jgi:predicted DsbA family dithiol-disulfide isomerase